MERTWADYQFIDFNFYNASPSKPGIWILWRKAAILNPDGRCKTLSLVQVQVKENQHEVKHQFFPFSVSRQRSQSHPPLFLTLVTFLRFDTTCNRRYFCVIWPAIWLLHDLGLGSECKKEMRKREIFRFRFASKWQVQVMSSSQEKRGKDFWTSITTFSILLPFTTIHTNNPSSSLPTISDIHSILRISFLSCCYFRIYSSFFHSSLRNLIHQLSHWPILSRLLNHLRPLSFFPSFLLSPIPPLHFCHHRKYGNFFSSLAIQTRVNPLFAFYLHLEKEHFGAYVPRPTLCSMSIFCKIDIPLPFLSPL